MTAKTHIRKYYPQMQQNRNNTHICQIPVMSYTRSTYRRHQIASEKTKLRFCIYTFKRTHKTGCMHIATSFSNNYIILPSSKSIFHVRIFSIISYDVTSTFVGVIATYPCVKA